MMEVDFDDMCQLYSSIEYTKTHIKAAKMICMNFVNQPET